MSKIKFYLTNGGLKNIIELGVQLLVYILIITFFMGKSYTNFLSLQHRVEKIETADEQQQECLQEIKMRLTALEENQERILEILQGKYNKE
ncbi:MAG TPA: hypothetical protein PLJ44_09560 [Victivallales bacterium]|nr:hypothetical protein [Victivallales bacterium]